MTETMEVPVKGFQSFIGVVLHRMNTHEEQIESQGTRIETLESVVEALRKKATTQEKTNQVHESRLDSQNKAIEELEEESAEEPPASAEEAPGTQAEKTPIERVADDPDTSGVRITASVQRALSIAGHFRDWCTKGARGTRAVTKNLRTLLGAAEDETLAWKQVYRAAETLEELSNGALTFKKTRRHGLIIELEDDAFLSRVVSGG